MALLSVADAEPQRGPVVAASDATADDAKRVMAEHHVDWVGVLDGDRLLGWVDGDALDRAPPLPASGARGASPPSVRLDDPVSGRRSTTIVQSRTRVAVVRDADDRYVGMVTIDDIAEAMAR